MTCKSRAPELANLLQQEKQQFAAAQLQDQEELKAIEARIRQVRLVPTFWQVGLFDSDTPFVPQVRKETATERRSLQNFQVVFLCVHVQHDVCRIPAS